MNKFIFLGMLSMAMVGCGKSAAPASAQDTAARRTCMDTIEARAINRNSVAYRSDDPAVAKDAKGQLAVSIKFSAKNEIGMATTMVAKCTVSPDGKTLVDIAVKEST